MGGYSGYCQASSCHRDYNNWFYFYYPRPVMIFWVQPSCKSRDGKYWKITVIESCGAECNLEWLQRSFCAALENRGPTKGCGIPALHLEQERSTHQSSSKMTWTERCLLLFADSQRALGRLKDDNKMVTIQFRPVRCFHSSCVCVCTFWGQKASIWSSKSACQLVLFTDSSISFACTPALICLKNKQVEFRCIPF